MDKNKPVEGTGLSSPKFRELMLALGGVVDATLNEEKGKRTIGFMLLVVDMEKDAGLANYLSNMKRSSMLLLMKEQLARFEEEAESKGGDLT